MKDKLVNRKYKKKKYNLNANKIAASNYTLLTLALLIIFVGLWFALSQPQDAESDPLALQTANKETLLNDYNGLIEDGKLDEAGTLLESGLEDSTVPYIDTPDYYILLSSLRQQQGDLEAAYQAAFRAYLNDDQTLPSVQIVLRLADTAYMTGRNEEAIRYYEEILVRFEEFDQEYIDSAADPEAGSLKEQIEAKISSLEAGEGFELPPEQE